MALLLVDNEDSFTFNLYHRLVRLTGINTSVLSYADLSSHDLTPYDGYIISPPGPGSPSAYPDYSLLFKLEKPIFGGVCLGMQIMNEFYGGEVSRLDECRHGVTLHIDYKGGVTKRWLFIILFIVIR